MKYLSRIEILINAHAELAYQSSVAGRMQAAVNADACAQGTCTACAHRTTERPVVMSGSVEDFN